MSVCVCLHEKFMDDEGRLVIHRVCMCQCVYIKCSQPELNPCVYAFIESTFLFFGMVVDIAMLNRERRVEGNNLSL